MFLLFRMVLAIVCRRIGTGQQGIQMIYERPQVTEIVDLAAGGRLDLPAPFHFAVAQVFGPHADEK